MLKSRLNQATFANCLLIVTLLNSPSVFAAKYYLSSDGSDASLGTREKPWKSLQRAVWKMKAGDELIIRSGNYRDASFGDLALPSTGKVTTIRSEPGEKVVFDGRLSAIDVLQGPWIKQSSTKRWKVKTNPEWKRLDGLWVAGKYFPRAKQIEELVAGKWYFERKLNEAFLEMPNENDPNTVHMEFRLHSMLELDTPFWLVQGITAQYYNYAGFTVSSTHHVTIRNCDAHYNGGSVIEADESTNLLIEDNRTSYNGAEGGPGWASGIHLWKTTSSKNIVRRNESYHNWDPSDHHTDGNGFSIDLGGATGGAEVYNNVAYDNGGRGIDIVAVSNVNLHDNRFFNNSRDPLIPDQGEVSISKAISAKGFQMDRNTLIAAGKNPPLVLFGDLEPNSIAGTSNSFCNSDSPHLSVTIYGKKNFSPDEWKKIPDVKLTFDQNCAR